MFLAVRATLALVTAIPATGTTGTRAPSTDVPAPAPSLAAAPGTVASSTAGAVTTTPARSDVWSDSCSRRDFCRDSDMKYRFIDCDRDGVLDPYCEDGHGNSGFLSSSQQCFNTWPSGGCSAQASKWLLSRAGAYCLNEKTLTEKTALNGVIDAARCGEMAAADAECGTETVTVRMVAPFNHCFCTLDKDPCTAYYNHSDYSIFKKRGVPPLAEDLTVMATFLPGRLGIGTTNWTSGVVNQIFPHGQGKRAGVKVGMRFVLVDGQPYTERLLDSKAAGNANYTVTFARQVRVHTAHASGQHLTSAPYSEKPELLHNLSLQMDGYNASGSDRNDKLVLGGLIAAGGTAVIGGAAGAIAQIVYNARITSTTTTPRTLLLRSAANAITPIDKIKMETGSFSNALLTFYQRHAVLVYIISGLAAIGCCAMCYIVILCKTKRRRTSHRSHRVISTERLSRLPQDDSEVEELQAQPESARYGGGDMSWQDGTPAMQLPADVLRSMSVSLGRPPSFQASPMPMAPAGASSPNYSANISYLGLDRSQDWMQGLPAYPMAAVGVDANQAGQPLMYSMAGSPVMGAVEVIPVLQPVLVNPAVQLASPRGASPTPARTASCRELDYSLGLLLGPPQQPQQFKGAEQAKPHY